MPRGVEQIDHALAVGELHHRAGDRNAALLFELHPVGGGMPRGLPGADFTGDLNRAAEPQQFFSQRGFTGIGVGNDGEGTAAGELFFEFLSRAGHGGK